MDHRSHSGAHITSPVRVPRHRRSVRLVLILFVAGSLVMLALRFLAGDLLGACTLSSPLGWTVPLTIALVAAAVWWLLSSQDRRRDPSQHAEPVEVACGACGRTVRSDWRLCPYCASVLEDSARRENDPPHGA